jgi:hypothetical protein
MGRKISFGVWYDFRNPTPWRRADNEVYDAGGDVRFTTMSG